MSFRDDWFPSFRTFRRYAREYGDDAYDDAYDDSDEDNGWSRRQRRRRYNNNNNSDNDDHISDSSSSNHGERNNHNFTIRNPWPFDGTFGRNRTEDNIEEEEVKQESSEDESEEDDDGTHKFTTEYNNHRIWSSDYTDYDSDIQYCPGFRKLMRSIDFTKKKKIKSVDRILRIITMYPKSLQQQNTKGEYPLHRICRCLDKNKVTPALEEIIVKIIAAYPQAAHEKDNNGWYPIHIACRYLSETIIRELLNVNPDAANIPIGPDKVEFIPRNEDDNSNFHPDDDITYTFATSGRYNHYENETSHKGWYPLHLSCQYQGSSNNNNSIISTLFALFPHVAKERIMVTYDSEKKSSNYPFALHIATRYNQPENVLLQLINEYPQAVKEKDYDKASDYPYPLHFACCYCQSSDIALLRLMDVYPEAVAYKSGKKGTYPFILACKYNQSDQILLHLIKVWPHITKMKLRTGGYPLHIVCYLYKLFKVIMTLIRIYPKAVGLLYDNKFPLNWACEKNLSKKIILTLLNICPQAAKHKDNKGYYPLQYALVHKQTEPVIYKLLYAYPQVTYQRNNRRGDYPLHLALKFYHSIPVILTLIYLNPLISKEQNKTILWPTTIAHDFKRPKEVYNLLSELWKKSYLALSSRIGLPAIVNGTALDKERR
jgi:ankyrin repeat protein